MIGPPRFASWLLEAALPTGDGDAITGDLIEEFQDRASFDPGRRHPFYGHPSPSRARLAATLPATLLLMQTFVLQQVPLKTTSELSSVFALVLAVVAVTAISAAAAFALRVLNPPMRR